MKEQKRYAAAPACCGDALPCRSVKFFKLAEGEDTLFFCFRYQVLCHNVKMTHVKTKALWKLSSVILCVFLCTFVKQETVVSLAI